MAAPHISVFVSHVPHGIDKNEFRQIFSQCGVVRDVYINPSKTDHPWTYGFVRFSSLLEAFKAVKEMDGWHLKDQRIRVELAKAIDKSALADVVNESKSLPAVNPTLQPPISYQESNVDKVVNLNRLQDICCMLNFESNRTKDTIYVGKILELIEQMNCSQKVPGMDLKVSEKAGSCFKSDMSDHMKQLPPATYDQFMKKHSEVNKTLQKLLPKRTLSSKSAHGGCTKQQSSKSPSESSSGMKSVKNGKLPTKTSSPSSSPSKRDKTNVPKEAAQTKKINQVKKSCGNDDASVMTISGSKSPSPEMKKGPNPNDFISRSKLSLLTESVCSADSSECLQSSHQKVSQFSQRFLEDHKIHSYFEQESGITAVNKEQNSDGFHFISKTSGNPSEESWDEEEENISRKNRSDWASELFFQILSDDSGISTAADDN